MADSALAFVQNSELKEVTFVWHLVAAAAAEVVAAVAVELAVFASVLHVLVEQPQFALRLPNRHWASPAVTMAELLMAFP